MLFDLVLILHGKRSSTKRVSYCPPANRAESIIVMWKEIGSYAYDLIFESPSHPQNGLASGFTPHDQLCDHGIIIGGDFNPE
jgi:hypothetical protein